MRPLGQGAGGILSYFTRHATAANLLLLLLVLAGIFSLPRMRTQFFPDVVVDSISVHVLWEGAGAEDVDQAIVAVLEPALLAVEGVSDSSTTSREGGAYLRLEFEPSWDMARALSDVETAVDAVDTLPDDAEDPVVRRGIWRDRVTDVVIYGPVDPEQLGRFADEMVLRLFDVGVTRSTIRGVAAPEIVVEVPSSALIRHDISMQEIAVAIAAEVDANPAGDVSGANQRLRTGVERRDTVSIAAIALRQNDDGSALRIGDLALLRQEGIGRERAYFVGADPAISIRIDRSDEGDAIAVQRLVEQVAAEMRPTLPRGVEIELIRTRSEAIIARLSILTDNGLLGLALVVGLLFLFLNARTAFWVAMGLPVAMLSALALMYTAGLTINMISLFALIITLGIVVDDAIVVGEHADFRANKLGETPKVAAENAARRMAAPVLAASITTVIAFGGLVVVGGRFGELIADIPFTVIVVLLASLVECFLILPNHMAHALARADREYWYDWPSRQMNAGLGLFRRHIFRPFIALVIRARYPVLALMMLLLATQVAAVMRGDLVWRFFVPPEQNSVSGNFAMLEGASREDSLAMMQEMQRAVEVVAARYEQEYGQNPLDFMLASLGGVTGRGLEIADNKSADLLGSVAIELIDSDLRDYSAQAFIGDLQQEIRRHPLVEALSFRSWRGGPPGNGVDVNLYGAEAAQLKAAALELQSRLSAFPEISALEDSMAFDREELILELTAQGEALGFEIEALGRVLRNRMGGIEAATFPAGPRSAAIRVELPEGELTADFLETMLMRSASGEYVPLADLVEVSTRQGFASVMRENGLSVVTVSGDIAEGDAARAAAIAAELEAGILPEIEAEFAVAWQLSGLSVEEDEFLADAMLGFGLCLVGIYLVLAWIFASWGRPMVVMAVIPFGMIGALWGHGSWGVPLSMFTVIGLIGMSGIIINDSIVLVTTVDEYARKRGLVPAIIDATADRLRPVLLTTLTTVLGLTPLLYEGSQQAEFLKPTVISLVYGLGFGLFVVLLLVPAVLAIGQDIGRLIRGLRRGYSAGGRAGGLSPGLVVASLLAALWFAATLGGWIAIGAPWGFAAQVAASPGQAFVAFAAGAAAISLLFWVLLGLSRGIRPQPRQP